MRSLQLPNTDPTALQNLYDVAVEIANMKGGKLDIAQFLGILNFPPPAAERLRNARGVLEAAIVGGRLVVSNQGTEISESIPGAGPFVEILIRHRLSCVLHVDTSAQSLMISEIKGLCIHVRGLINPDLDGVSIALPNHVTLEW